MCDGAQGYNERWCGQVHPKRPGSLRFQTYTAGRRLGFGG